MMFSLIHLNESRFLGDFIFDPTKIHIQQLMVCWFLRSITFWLVPSRRFFVDWQAKPTRRQLRRLGSCTCRNHQDYLEAFIFQGVHIQYIRSWWLNQPLWTNMLVKMGSSSPIFGVNIKKFETATYRYMYHIYVHFFQHRSRVITNFMVCTLEPP